MRPNRDAKHSRSKIAYQVLLAATGLLAIPIDGQAQESTALSLSYSPSYSWSGAYFGAQTGGGWARAHYSLGPATRRRPAQPIDMAGGLAGVYAGYNFQSGPLVAGMEADFAKTWIRGDRFVVPLNAMSVGSQIDWSVSVRGRLGYAIGNFLPYIAGGVTFADANFPTALYGGQAPRNDHQSHVGWTIGAGIEYGLSENLILRTEYRHTDFGKKYVFRTMPDGSADRPAQTSIATDEIRVGIAWKLGAPSGWGEQALPWAKLPPFDWSGPYAGAQAGFAWERSSYYPLTAISSRVQLNTSTTVPWIFAGYNWQVGRIVLGGEGDVLLSKINSRGVLRDAHGTPYPDFQVASALDHAWSVRGRLGFAFGRFLPYITGGVAGAKFSHTVETPFEQRKFNHRFTRWTAGAGVDYALTNHLLVRAEYRYTPYGEVTPRGGPRHMIDVRTDEVRIGAAFKL